MPPDHSELSWHEYGMRVGFCDQKMMPRPGHFADRDAHNARSLRDLPDGGEGLRPTTAGSSTRTVVRPGADAQARRPACAVIMKSMDVIEQFLRQASARGWFGPGLTQTFDTPDYFSEAGIEYRRPGPGRRA